MSAVQKTKTPSRTYTAIQASMFTSGYRSHTELARIVAKQLGYKFDEHEHIVDADGYFVANTIEEIAEPIVNLKWVYSNPASNSGVNWGAFDSNDPDACTKAIWAERERIFLGK